MIGLGGFRDGSNFLSVKRGVSDDIFCFVIYTTAIWA